MKTLLITTFILVFSVQLRAQSSLTSTMSTKDQDLLVVNNIPDGDFYTVQVATVYGKVKYIGYDDRLIGGLILFNPVYLYSQGNAHTLCVGVFNDKEAATTYSKKIGCIFNNGPFPIAFSGGKKVSVSSISEGTIPTKFKKIKKVKGWLKKQLKKGFYRVRFGYFEKPGFTPEVQKQVDALAANGVDLIEEPFKNGRLMVSKKKFKTIDEAIAYRDEQCGAYTDYKMIRRYYVDEGIWLDHMNIFYECLSN